MLCLNCCLTKCCEDPECSRFVASTNKAVAKHKLEANHISGSSVSACVASYNSSCGGVWVGFLCPVGCCTICFGSDYGQESKDFTWPMDNQLLECVKVLASKKRNRKWVVKEGNLLCGKTSELHMYRLGWTHIYIYNILFILICFCVLF